MTQWVLKKNGQVFLWSTLQNLTQEQLTPLNEVQQQKRVFFDTNIRRILGDSFSFPVNGMPLETGDVIKEKCDIFYGPTPFLTDED